MHFCCVCLSLYQNYRVLYFIEIFVILSLWIHSWAYYYEIAAFLESNLQPNGTLYKCKFAKQLFIGLHNADLTWFRDVAFCCDFSFVLRKMVVKMWKSVETIEVLRGTKDWIFFLSYFVQMYKTMQKSSLPNLKVLLLDVFENMWVVFLLTCHAVLPFEN